jgi:hypothetical protein
LKKKKFGQKTRRKPKYTRGKKKYFPSPQSWDEAQDMPGSLAALGDFGAAPAGPKTSRSAENTGAFPKKNPWHPKTTKIRLQTQGTCLKGSID